MCTIVTYQLIVIKDVHCLPQNYIRKQDEMFGFIFYVYECFPACMLGVRGGCEPPCGHWELNLGPL